MKKKKKKPLKVCGDCIHLDACAGQNLTGVVYMMETDATCCGNYETIWSLFDRVKPLVEKYMRDQKDNRMEERGAIVLELKDGGVVRRVRINPDGSIERLWKEEQD